jgi:hypothetical protein
MSTKGITHADARQGDLLYAIDHPGLGNAHCLEDCRSDVDEVRVLPTISPLALNPWSHRTTMPWFCPPPCTALMHQVAGVEPAMAQPTA